MGPKHLKIREPILEPEGEIGAIFNPGAESKDGYTYLLPRIVKKGYFKGERGEFENYISIIGLAKSKNEESFELLDKNFIKPEFTYERDGCEDARCTKLDGNYFIPYTAFSKSRGPRIALALTKDFENVKKYGIIGPDYNSKAGVFFPEKIDDKLVLLFKNEDYVERTQIAYLEEDIIFDSKYRKEFWKSYEANKYVLLPEREYTYHENLGTEPGTQPIKTKEGWVIIYSSISKEPAWYISVALLDLDEPHKVIARSENPILEPADYKKYYDIKEDVENVVFPTGAILKKKRKKEVTIYFGVGDKICASARCDLDELLSCLI